MELIQRYARRRMLGAMSDELVQKAVRTGNGIKPSERQREEHNQSGSQYWRRGGTKTYLTATILGRFDTNKNGRLDEDEPSQLGIPKGRLDIDRDGEISREELQQYVGDLQDVAGDTSEVVPGWFYELDKNRDKQVSMIEFAEEWSDQKSIEFASYDGNGDGLLTATEILNSKALVGGSYTNKEAVIIPPRKTIISEIEVTDQFIVGDVNLYLSLTHSHTSYLDAYLTGPDGTRIELFTAVGGSDDNFDQTVFDDQSAHPVAKARPPFKGTFQPEGLSRKQPSLAAFNDKPIQGVWQLVVRATRSDRFGMLHAWGLQVTPKSDLIEGAAPQPMQDGPVTGQQQSGNPQSGKPEKREERSANQRSQEDSVARVRERYEQAEGWTRDIKARLSSNDISEDERRGLSKKMEQIERYKEQLREKAEKGEKGGKIKEKRGKERAFFKDR